MRHARLIFSATLALVFVTLGATTAFAQSYGVRVGGNLELYKEDPKITTEIEEYYIEQPSFWQLGARLGATQSILAAPTDQATEYTLMNGESFAGMGLGGALDLRWVFYNGYRWQFFTQLSVGLTHDKSSAEEIDKADKSKRRQLHLESYIVRVPWVVGARLSGGDYVGFSAFVGLEGILGVHSDAYVTQLNLTTPQAPIDTKSVQHVGIHAGGEIEFTYKSFSLPLTVTYTYDPFVASKTRDRFDNFVSEANPGSLKLAYSHQLFFGLGVRHSFF